VGDVQRAHLSDHFVCEPFDPRAFGVVEQQRGFGGVVAERGQPGCGVGASDLLRAVQPNHLRL